MQASWQDSICGSFCLCCSVESPCLPYYICPRCRSGFTQDHPERTRNALMSPLPNPHGPELATASAQTAFSSLTTPTSTSGAQPQDGRKCRDPENWCERETKFWLPPHSPNSAACSFLGVPESAVPLLFLI